MKAINPPNTLPMWLLWAFFLNEDDPLWGDAAFNPTQKDSAWWRIKWWFRNPAHNFTFYVIGVAHKQITRIGKYPNDVFSPVPGWNWAVAYTEPDGWFPLAFVSYTGRYVRWYVGWRERGNFGLKLTAAPKKPAVSAPQ